jgi:hypothetical protein
MATADNLRRQLQTLQSQMAAESKKDSDASSRAAKAREQATRTSSESMTKMKLREADREEQKALAARKKRAEIDRKVADVIKKLYAEESKVARDQARSFQRLQDELQQRQQATAYEVGQVIAADVPTSTEPTELDFFISHAGPDKEAIARPLKDALEARDCKVWIDETQIQVGDSLRQKIDQGLRRSRFGIVILSRSFLAGREWTERELNGLFVREEEAGEPRILPIWHDVTKSEVAAYSPILADKAALKSADYTLDEMADLLVKRLGKSEEG